MRKRRTPRCGRMCDGVDFCYREYCWADISEDELEDIRLLISLIPFGNLQLFSTIFERLYRSGFDGLDHWEDHHTVWAFLQVLSDYNYERLQRKDIV